MSFKRGPRRETMLKEKPDGTSGTMLSRRGFLRFSAGSAVSLAGFGLHRHDMLVSSPVPLSGASPAKRLQFATTCRECPAGCGMTALHTDGRTTKAEAMPGHPVSRGGLCPRGQSAPQGLYDPDRVPGVLARRNNVFIPSSFTEAVPAISERMQRDGKLLVVSNLQTGPLAEILESFAAAFNGRLLMYEPFSYAPLRHAHAQTMGRAVIPRYRIDRCKTVLSLSADFLETWLSNVEFTKQFTAMHSTEKGDPGMFFYAGPRLSMTAANADEFLHVPPGVEADVGLAVLKSMLERDMLRINPERIRPLVRDVDAAKLPLKDAVRRIENLAGFFGTGPAVALAGPVGGEGLLAQRTALAAALLNESVGMPGVETGRAHALGRTTGREELSRALEEMGEEDVLLIHCANPAFTDPGMAEALDRPGTVVALASMPDETATRADWVLPVDTSLEAFGSYEPWTGIHCLLQPTMGRVFETRNAGDILLALAQAAGRPLSRVPGQPPTGDFRGWWEGHLRGLHAQSGTDLPYGRFRTETLQRGFVTLPAPVSETAPFSLPEITLPPGPAGPPSGTVELWAWPSIFLFDGSLANRSWLQENPHPMSASAWSSWLDVHPDTAAALEVGDDDFLEIRSGQRAATLAVRITRDVLPNMAAFGIGQGHTALGRNARDLGANAFLFMGSGPQSLFGRVTLAKKEEGEPRVSLASTDDQHGRDILRWVSADALRQSLPGEGEEITWPTPEGYRRDRDLYPGHLHAGHRWAMVIDLDRCIGCAACSVACYAENNIPTAGREPLLSPGGREQTWIKVVPYRSPDKTRFGWLPLPCQHCDAAPCEPVCPVFASVHNEEGLNAQVYNRCIGTRYCSNNCPYKVRRFNWSNHHWSPPLTWQLNPEVTVRSRGVMEKCTFCVQRILYAEHKARIEDRPVRDGEIVPACVQTCPADVFVFGDLLDPDSAVSRLFRTETRRYQLLREKNTKPAVLYLKRVARGSGIVQEG